MVAPAVVTAVIPCYNQGRFLEECLASLRAQTRDDWQAIVLDDASTDQQTPALCDAQAQADSRVRVLHLAPNHGRALVRNVGIAAATTEAILNLDADDALEPTHFARTVPLLLADPQVGVVYTDYQRFGARTDRLRGRPFDLAAMYRIRYVWAGSLFRKSAWAATPGFRDAFRDGNEDYDFYLSLVEAGYVGQYVPEPLFRYRCHPDSWTSSGVGGDDRVFRTRLALYAHHQTGFDRHGARRAFLAATYEDEATRVLAGGDQATAHALLGRALRHAPWRPRLWRRWLQTAGRGQPPPGPPPPAKLP
ncbi:MAG: glycosyltransferase family A protein [Myxococcota bacterium]|jgi:glycosyltransferase involved in cell wall biosynthesis|nr:glycosyltransferase family A protein [Myxococcota bacterium]